MRNIDDYLSKYNIRLPLLLRFVKERGGNTVMAESVLEEWLIADRSFTDQHDLEQTLIKETAVPEALERLAEKMVALKKDLDFRVRELRQPWKFLSGLIWR